MENPQTNICSWKKLHVLNPHSLIVLWCPNTWKKYVFLLQHQCYWFQCKFHSLHQLVGLVGVDLIPSLLNDETIQMNILPFYTSIDSVCFWSCVAMGMQVQLLIKTMVLSQSNSAQDFGLLARLHQWRQAENTWVLWKLEQKMLGSKWISRLYCQLPIMQHKAFSVALEIFWTQTKKKKTKRQIYIYI